MLTGASLDGFLPQAITSRPHPILLVSFVSLRASIYQQLRKSVFKNRGNAVFHSGKAVGANRCVLPDRLLTAAETKPQRKAPKKPKSAVRQALIDKLQQADILGNEELKIWWELMDQQSEQESISEEIELFDAIKEDFLGAVSPVLSVEKSSTEIRLHYQNRGLRKFTLSNRGCKESFHTLKWYSDYQAAYN